MADAICLRCGFEKSAPWKKCKRCEFDPAGDEEALIRSVYLSVGRFSDSEEVAAYRLELDHVGHGIERGDKPIFLEREIARLRSEKRSFEQVPISAVWGAVFRLFFPAIGFLFVLFLLLFLLK